ncbi:MAG: 50S ribosomal protein L9 [Deltaproteobacteria bacterium]|nr:50S ribosomal protein L9 [Deltaproteobacteria bacterium]
MEVVLKEDIENLGHMGDVVKVKDGYARNYLLPRGLVVLANNKNLKALEHEQRMISQRRERLTKEAQGISDKLAGVSLEFTAKVGEEGRLFGSVTTMDIEKALKEQGFEVERRRIVLDAPIKNVGDYEVPIRLRPEVTPSIKVKVMSEDQPEAGEVPAEAADGEAETASAEAVGGEAPSSEGEEGSAEGDRNEPSATSE